MADDSLPLSELMCKAGANDPQDFLRKSLEMMARMLMEMEVMQLTGAALHERSDERQVQRNGYRPRRWDTRVGSIELQIPKLRQGSYFPSILEPRRRAERALVSVIQEAYVKGVSTRKVDDLVQAMGLEGVDKSMVSRLCQELDDQVEQFRNRPLEGQWVYIWLDATYLKVREDGRVRNMAMVVAVGVNNEGKREVLGLDLGPAEDEAFWTVFLRSLVARGLTGVQLITSDCHLGLKKAIAAVVNGASWQRCRVHFMRNVLSHVPKSAQQMVAATVRTIFNQSDAETAHKQVESVADTLEKRFPRVSALLRESAEDVLAFMAFPEEHARQIYSTNPLERLNKEIKRRTDVVGIFPTRTSAIRLVGALLMEQSDEWAVSRRYLTQSSLEKINDGSRRGREVEGGKTKIVPFK
ncbi:MAG: IS256 family transposase [Proteobacteria bacterium]|nr:IS256 family transposase [Pseudomonadota bacterium]